MFRSSFNSTESTGPKESSSSTQGACPHDHQRRPIPTTKTLLTRFQQAVVGLEGGLDTAGNKKLHQLQIDAARAQTEDLAAEIDEYEQLLSGATTSFSADSLSDLPLMLVRARVARGWSQRQLGSALGIAEQQIQRYEANGYATASLTRLCEVADALGLQIRETAELTPNTNAA